MVNTEQINAFNVKINDTYNLEFWINNYYKY